MAKTTNKHSFTVGDIVEARADNYRHFFEVIRVSHSYVWPQPLMYPQRHNFATQGSRNGNITRHYVRTPGPAHRDHDCIPNLIQGATGCRWNGQPLAEVARDFARTGPAPIAARPMAKLLQFPRRAA
jgi:hypothetical protein